MIDVKIRFVDTTIADKALRIEAKTSVALIKSLLLAQHSEPHEARQYYRHIGYADDRQVRIRLITMGRLLEDSERIGDLLRRNDDCLTLHCMISRVEHDDPARNASDPAPAPRLGFDRLLDMGLSEQGVQELRSQFHALRSLDGGPRSS
ncbi:hypothetical protein HDU91_003854 [Kappamyces sp. JEL0680]|nr:hypothetical protein HDU91_003854 [Kappamyces sp. JEL0680]